MDRHPYSSQIFRTKWIKHFTSPPNVIDFESISGQSFLKTKRRSIYYNTGSNFTLQHYYCINNPVHSKELNKKTIIIYDVPNYFVINNRFENPKIKIVKVKEYIGYLIDTNGVTSLESYIKSRFSSKKRTQIKGYIKKIEATFNIQYKMFFGEITKIEYDSIMKYFYDLSIISFNKKKIKNTKLIPKNFAFTREVLFDLIQLQQASIFVIYNDKIPIGISLNYNSDTILFGDSTVYDSSYSKFNVGTIMLIKQLEWCFSKGIKKFDFSKGYFPYKKTWCNTPYHFEHHIIFDSSSFLTKITAYRHIYYLKLKQFLREHPLRNYLKSLIKKN